MPASFCLNHATAQHLHQVQLPWSTGFIMMMTTDMLEDMPLTTIYGHGGESMQNQPSANDDKLDNNDHDGKNR